MKHYDCSKPWDFRDMNLEENMVVSEIVSSIIDETIEMDKAPDWMVRFFRTGLANIWDHFVKETANCIEGYVQYNRLSADQREKVISVFEYLSVDSIVGHMVFAMSDYIKTFFNRDKPIVSLPTLYAFKHFEMEEELNAEIEHLAKSFSAKVLDKHWGRHKDAFFNAMLVLARRLQAQ